MTIEEIIEECKQRLGFETDYEMYSLCQHEKDFLKAIIKALEQPTADDCVSRQAVLNTLFYKSDNNCEVVLNKELQDRIKALPPVTPTHGTCKECEHWNGYRYCTWIGTQTEADFYCKDFEKRGDSDDSN